jgi:hypothetical protein
MLASPPEFAEKQGGSRMEPYVIADGDYLALLAYQQDFDADTVWNDPANDDLRALRPDPNLLWPTDILHVPNQMNKMPVTHTLAPGSTTTFVSTPPTLPVAVKFTGADPSAYASKAYVVKELEDLTGLTTNGDGLATFDAPITLQTMTVVFTDSGEAWRLKIGSMDPIETLSGIWQRLQNLGYLDGDIELDPDNLDPLRVALTRLKEIVQPDADDAPASAPPAPPAGGGTSEPAGGSPPSGSIDADPTWDASSDSSDSSPPSSDGGPDSNPGSATSSATALSSPADSPSPDSSSLDSDPGPDSSPPDSGAGPDGDPATLPPADDAGLSDDGTLRDDLKSLLVQAHGY